MVRRVVSRTKESWGIDVDESVLPADFPGAHFRAVKPTGPLPFADASFDTIMIMEVIEHVADERATLTECARVLASGGYLLLTTPHRGLLTFLDTGNFKFIAPSLHKFIHCRMIGDKNYYTQRFGSERRETAGMIADFTTDQDCWHRHYRYSQIRTLAPSGLRTVAWTVYYPGLRACDCALVFSKVLTRGRFSKTPWPFSTWTRWASRRETLLGDQLVILFQKD
jgi:SAM-dependent methyltransferase